MKDTAVDHDTTGSDKAAGAALRPGQSFIILCHSDKNQGKRGTGSGPIEPLLAYLIARQARWIFLIEQPHPQTPGTLDCTLEVYRDGALVATHVSRRWQALYNIAPGKRASRTYLRLKLRDVLSAWEFLGLIGRTYREAAPFNCLFGVEFINALLGNAFRYRLRIQRVVYYLFDWAPRRYANRWMNRLYLVLDRRACRTSDFIWNITWAIADARREVLHYNPRRMGVELTVPYGVAFRADLVQPYAALEHFNVVFAGGLHDANGAQWLPEIAARLQAGNPRIRLLVAGDGTLMPMIRAAVRERGLQNMTLLGHLADPAEIDRLQCRCLIGLAPYPDVPGTTKRWGDVIKIRSYFACGLVVVSTAIPPVAREIRAEELGAVCPEDPAALADAILALCADEARLQQCRKRVIQKARGHHWSAIYDQAFARMEATRAAR